MYCMHCGKQIEDNSKFCPYCGGSLSTSDTGSVKEALKKTAGAVMDSAKAIGNSVNEATGGQAGKYAEKAKETAKDFTDDVKQVARDKDTSNFFTKNKYRNVKIIAVMLIAVFLLSSLFGGGSKGEKMAKDIVSASCDCKIKSVTEVAKNSNADTYIYVVKYIPSNEGEHSAIVYVNPKSGADIQGVYQKSRYDELNTEIENWKLILETGNKQK